jgi:flagellar biosynthesis component FlhA
MLELLDRLERARQARAEMVFGSFGLRPASFFGVAFAVLLLSVVPPVGMIPLATLASFLAVLTLALAGIVFLVTVVLAPASLLFF